MYETWYVDATKVQGDSFEVGAKVMYQGREMVVSKGIDNDGEIKMTDLSGLKTLAEALPKTSITTLECAASYCARDSLISPPARLFVPALKPATDDPVTTLS